MIPGKLLILSTCCCKCWGFFAVVTSQPHSCNCEHIALNIKGSLSSSNTVISNWRVILVLSLLVAGCFAKFAWKYASADTGTLMAKQVPLPTCERNEIFSPKMVAIRSDIANPKPNPGTSRFRSNRSNSRKICCCLSSAIPGPLSHTSMLIWLAKRLTPSKILLLLSLLLLSLQ